jgi:uncharacterized protein YkwD
MYAGIRMPRMAVAGLALAALALLWTPQKAGAASTQCLNATQPLGLLSRGILKSTEACLINEVRARSGLHVLTVRRRLFRPARHHNADMQNHIHHMSHNSSNGDSFSTRIKRYGYMSGANRWTVGEIIGEAWGPGATPLKILNGWLNSPPHNRIIHTAKFRDFGVAGRPGTAENPNANGALFTADFGYRSPSF